MNIKYFFVIFLALSLLFSLCGCEEEEVPELPPFPEEAPMSFTGGFVGVTGNVVAEPVVVTNGVSVTPSTAEPGETVLFQVKPEGDDEGIYAMYKTLYVDDVESSYIINNEFARQSNRYTAVISEMSSYESVEVLYTAPLTEGSVKLAAVGYKLVDNNWDLSKYYVFEAELQVVMEEEPEVACEEGTSFCREDGVTRAYCEGGVWNEEICDYQCLDGECIEEPVEAPNVYYVSPPTGELELGTDIPSGTMEDPFYSINWAIYNAEPPATVYVTPGEYYYKEPRKTTDLHISMRENVNLICTEKQECIIHGPIYGASNTILDGFYLAKAKEQTCVREIFLGVSRYGSPYSHNIHAPHKYDIYGKSVTNMTVRNNVVSDNCIRLASDDIVAQMTVVDDLTNEEKIVQSAKIYVENNIIENNVQFLDRYDSHFWGIGLVESHNNIIRNNQIQSGRAISKQDNFPNSPAAILLMNSKGNKFISNELYVNSDGKGNKIGYCTIVYDVDKYETNSANNELSNVCQGDYMGEFIDLTDKCGNGICEELEYTNPFGGDIVYCREDCCGDGVCADTEAITKNPKGGLWPHYCEEDCGHLAVCGDGVCQTLEYSNPSGGDIDYCRADCCGDGVCADVEAIIKHPKGGSWPHYCEEDCG